MIIPCGSQKAIGQGHNFIDEIKIPKNDWKQKYKEV